MPAPAIRIIQGTDAPYPAATVSVVIDVIRAFTVAQIAFLRGLREIYLVNTVEEAHAFRKLHPDYLLAGEVDGLPIAGFDLDNSPQRFSTADIHGKTLIQKTSNGVKGTLLALAADNVLVTGFSNARNTAQYARALTAGKSGATINIVATHPSDDDDLACAEYIRDIVLVENKVSASDIARRILAARSAVKFYGPGKPAALDARDPEHCARETPCNFVMQVDKSVSPPRVLRHTLA